MLRFSNTLNSYEISKSNKIKCLSLIKGNVKKIDFINSPLPIINWIKNRVEKKTKI